MSDALGIGNDQKQEYIYVSFEVIAIPFQLSIRILQ
jgi:hypothetical protein